MTARHMSTPLVQFFCVAAASTALCGCDIYCAVKCFFSDTFSSQKIRVLVVHTVASEGKDNDRLAENLWSNEVKPAVTGVLKYLSKSTRRYVEDYAFDSDYNLSEAEKILFIKDTRKRAHQALSFLKGLKDKQMNTSLIIEIDTKNGALELDGRIWHGERGSSERLRDKFSIDLKDIDDQKKLKLALQDFSIDLAETLYDVLPKNAGGSDSGKTALACMRSCIFEK